MLHNNECPKASSINDPPMHHFFNPSTIAEFTVHLLREMESKTINITMRYVQV